MIDSTNTLLSLTGSGSGSTERVDTNKDAFLTLLLTQLQNQDPLSPLQAHEFASQLASFTSVEQLTQLNAELAFQTDGVLLATQLSKTALSASLIGRQIVAEGDSVIIPDSGSAVVHVDVGATGGSATLRLLDASGKEVASRDLGVIPGGRQTLSLPDDLPAGTYRYELLVTDEQGSAVPVVTYTAGVVEGVTFRDGQILLRIGSIEVDLEALTDIGPGGSTGTPGDTGEEPGDLGRLVRWFTNQGGTGDDRS
jgi:flagellar basal-body rod modification protein FlgD